MVLGLPGMCLACLLYTSKYATNEERAKMLTSLIPLTDENKAKMKVVESASLYRGCLLYTSTYDTPSQ